MQATIKDKILIEGLEEGNVKIYDLIFLHYYSGLVTYAVNKGVNKDVAEDLVQDFFLKLWLNRKAITITGSLKSYLFTSIKNRCFDYFRHEKVERNLKEQLSFEESMDDKDDFLTEDDLRRQIDDALKKLPPKCQKIFIMNRLEGLKPNEIAELEGLSVRTIEGHIGKAIRLLREELKDVMPIYIVLVLL
ncbi:MAG: RNA polymerase sigma-70 factor [Mangrovibacterium sp.]